MMMIRKLKIIIPLSIASFALIGCIQSRGLHFMMQSSKHSSSVPKPNRSRPTKPPMSLRNQSRSSGRNNQNNHQSNSSRSQPTQQVQAPRNTNVPNRVIPVNVTQVNQSPETTHETVQNTNVHQRMTQSVPLRNENRSTSLSQGNTSQDSMPPIGPPPGLSNQQTQVFTSESSTLDLLNTMLNSNQSSQQFLPSINNQKVIQLLLSKYLNTSNEIEKLKSTLQANENEEESESLLQKEFESIQKSLLEIKDRHNELLKSNTITSQELNPLNNQPFITSPQETQNISWIEDLSPISNQSVGSSNSTKSSTSFSYSEIVKGKLDRKTPPKELNNNVPQSKSKVPSNKRNPYFSSVTSLNNEPSPGKFDVISLSSFSSSDSHHSKSHEIRYDKRNKSDIFLHNQRKDQEYARNKRSRKSQKQNKPVEKKHTYKVKHNKSPNKIKYKQHEEWNVTPMERQRFNEKTKKHYRKKVNTIPTKSTLEPLKIGVKPKPKKVNPSKNEKEDQIMAFMKQMEEIQKSIRNLEVSIKDKNQTDSIPKLNEDIQIEENDEKEKAEDQSDRSLPVDINQKVTKDLELESETPSSDEDSTEEESQIPRTSYWSNWGLESYYHSVTQFLGFNKPQNINTNIVEKDGSESDSEDLLNSESSDNSVSSGEYEVEVKPVPKVKLEPTKNKKRKKLKHRRKKHQEKSKKKKCKRSKPLKRLRNNNQQKINLPTTVKDLEICDKVQSTTKKVCQKKYGWIWGVGSICALAVAHYFSGGVMVQPNKVDLGFGDVSSAKISIGNSFARYKSYSGDSIAENTYIPHPKKWLKKKFPKCGVIDYKKALCKQYPESSDCTPNYNDPLRDRNTQTMLVSCKKWDKLFYFSEGIISHEITLGEQSQFS